MEYTKSTEFNQVKVQHYDNIIINIQPNQTEEVNELPGYTKDNGSIVNNTNCELCWNCCHCIDNYNAKSIPMKYTNHTFYIYGYFCSYNCGARYIFDTFNDKRKWELYSLLNLYYNISNKTTSHHIPLAPNKLVLRKFGGTMDIDEYRSNNLSYELVLTPIIPVDHTFKIIKDYKITSTENKSHYKLYRKKTIHNNIYDTMNLVTDNETITDSL